MDAFSPSEQYLQDFHQRRPGATSAAFAALPAKTPSGAYRSSYEVLAALARELPSRSTVLDVGCGDGHLLGLLNVTSPESNLVGVDLSQGELEVARRTLPSQVLLLRERAQQLSLESGSVDLVVSHMALMLMDDIEAVLSEVHRVLAPGGRFAAIVGRTFMLGPLNDIFLDIFLPIAKADLSLMAMGDRRTRSADGWIDLLRSDFDDLHTEDVDVAWSPTPGELWHALIETYDIDRLSAAAQHKLKDALVAETSSMLDSEGRLHTGWGLRFIQAKAR